MAANATVGELLPLEDVIAHATGLHEVEVIKKTRLDTADGELCGTRYLAKVFNSYRGAPASGVITFGRTPQLQVGERYIVMLSTVEFSRQFDLTDARISSELVECYGVNSEPWVITTHLIRIRRHLAESPVQIKGLKLVKKDGRLYSYRSHEVRSQLKKLVAQAKAANGARPPSTVTN
jgi:hypothetical protein